MLNLPRFNFFFFVRVRYSASFSPRLTRCSPSLLCSALTFRLETVVPPFQPRSRSRPWTASVLFCSVWV